jgi:hypothetical protein
MCLNQMDQTLSIRFRWSKPSEMPYEEWTDEGYLLDWCEITFDNWLFQHETTVRNGESDEYYLGYGQLKIAQSLHNCSTRAKEFIAGLQLQHSSASETRCLNNYIMKADNRQRGPWYDGRHPLSKWSRLVGVAGAMVYDYWEDNNLFGLPHFDEGMGITEVWEGRTLQRGFQPIPFFICP